MFVFNTSTIFRGTELTFYANLEATAAPASQYTLACEYVVSGTLMFISLRIQTGYTELNVSQ